MAGPAAEGTPLRVLIAVYASGYLSTSLQNMATLLIPLWVVQTMHPSAFVIGVIIGSRQALPAVFAIHGGAMMDRLGAKRVMAVFAAAGILVPVLYPVTPWIWAIIVLQMLGGLVTTMSWMGAQTLIGQVLKGDPVHSGRLSSAALIGNLTVPPIMGAVWDHFGAWGGFLTLSLWSAGIVLATAVLPAPSRELAGAGEPIRLRDFVPRLTSYIEAIALLSIPAIAVVVMVSVLRNTTYAIRGSFFVVYLDGIHLTGTEIGIVMSAAGAVGAVAALQAGRLSKLVDPVVLLFITVAGAVVFMSSIPLMGAFWQLLVVAGAWGASVGMSMPLMISITARAADARSQGKTVATRLAANRTAAAGLPVIMGAVADAFGIGDSFLIVGAALLLAQGAIVLYYRRITRPSAPLHGGAGGPR